MIRLGIFDMDGVLVDSEDAITRAALQTLREDYGLPAQYEDFKPFTGMGERVFIGSVAEKYGATAKRIDNAGHLLNYETPEVAAKIIKNFIES